MTAEAALNSGLDFHVADHEALGCQRCSLGAVSMPPGYALMLDADEQYYYWLDKDGRESVIHWSRWAVYHGAVRDAKRGES